MAHNQFHERLINLTFALLNASSTGGKYLTAEWIRSHVAGYENRSDAAFQRLFARDRDILAKVGVPIETISSTPDEDVPGYRLQQEQYCLPEINFTTEEATVLALAGDKGLSAELAAFARSGWTKLAAAGASTIAEHTPNSVGFTEVSDLSVLSAQVLDTVNLARKHNQRIEFDYTAHAAAAATRRTMDPWGIINHEGRWYLVGFDIDRDAPRTFRIIRVSNITPTVAATHPIPENLQDIVANSLRSRKTLIDAQLTITADTAGELSSRATHHDGDTYYFEDIDRDWLVRTAAAYAPDALVVAPADVRNEVIAQLQRATRNPQKDH